jgi:hypothetical protein
MITAKLKLGTTPEQLGALRQKLLVYRDDVLNLRYTELRWSPATSSPSRVGEY